MYVNESTLFLRILPAVGTYTKVVALPFHHINSQIPKWSVLPALSFVDDASARVCSILKLVPDAFAFCGNETV